MLYNVWLPLVSSVEKYLENRNQTGNCRRVVPCGLWSEKFWGLFCYTSKNFLKRK